MKEGKENERNNKANKKKREIWIEAKIAQLIETGKNEHYLLQKEKKEHEIQTLIQKGASEARKLYEETKHQNLAVRGKRELMFQVDRFFLWNIFL